MTREIESESANVARESGRDADDIGRECDSDAGSDNFVDDGRLGDVSSVLEEIKACLKKYERYVPSYFIRFVHHLIRSLHTDKMLNKNDPHSLVQEVFFAIEFARKELMCSAVTLFLAIQQLFAEYEMQKESSTFKDNKELKTLKAFVKTSMFEVLKILQEKIIAEKFSDQCKGSKILSFRSSNSDNDSSTDNSSGSSSSVDKEESVKPPSTATGRKLSFKDINAQMDSEKVYFMRF